MIIRIKEQVQIQTQIQIQLNIPLSASKFASYFGNYNSEVDVKQKVPGNWDPRIPLFPSAGLACSILFQISERKL